MLKPQDAAATAVAERWDQFIRYLCLSLSQALGTDVKVHRKSDLQAAVKRLCADGVLASSIRVPDAAGPISLEADLRASRFTCGVVVDAPQDKQRAAAPINWLLRQLDPAISGQVVEVAFANARETVAKPLADVEHPNDLLSPADPKRMPRRFTVTLSRKMGVRRAGGRGFITEAESQAADFYRQVVQGLKAWRPAAPKLAQKVLEEAPPTGPEQAERAATLAGVSPCEREPAPRQTSS